MLDIDRVHCDSARVDVVVVVVVRNGRRAVVRSGIVRRGREGMLGFL